VNAGKLLSLTAFLSTAIVMAVVCVIAPVRGDLPFAVLAALVAGAGTTVALVVGFVSASLIDQPIERYRGSVAQRAERGGATNHVPQWMRPLAETVENTLHDQRRRIEELNGRRRELEIQSRVVDSERQQIHAILHSISDAVIVTDAFNELSMANATAENTFRFELCDARHQPIERVIGDAALVKLIKDLRAGAGPNQRRRIEHRIAHAGRSNVYEVALGTVVNDLGEVTGVVTILHDVTRERAISEMKSDFVSGVSHELRTPLSSIKAYVEMLVDGEANDEQTRSEFYHIIQSETNRLSRLIDNILNISRIESGITKIQREAVALPELIAEAVGVLQPQARAKDIQLTERSSGRFCSVYADRDMIYQTLLNLIGNGIKYTPQGGCVTVDTVVDDVNRQVAIAVSDTGVGIPEEDLPFLFDKFYRVADHKKIAKGTGLGLSLVKQIVEVVHQGRIEIESEVGKGSTFRIVLPLITTASPTGAPPSHRAQRSTANRRKNSASSWSTTRPTSSTSCP